LVERKKVHGVWVFRCAMPREEFVLQESKSFLSRFFDSDPVPLVAHLVNNDMLSSADIARLRALLDDQPSKREETSRD
jgi:predicted transcriptional regulator